MESLWYTNWNRRVCRKGKCEVESSSRLIGPKGQEKKKEIWLGPVTKAPTPTEKSKKQPDNTKKLHKNFDYTTITDRLRTVSWSNNSHPTGGVKPVNEHSTFPLTAKVV